MKIGDCDLSRDILIVAEIGNNHEGSYTLAEEMIGLAAKAGAGAVKFQAIVPDKLVSPGQKDRIQQLERFRLSYEEFEKLSKVAAKENILFLCTPFDIESARFLEPLVPAFKIASGDNNFFPMIDVIARTGKPIILSAGLTDLAHISQTKSFIEDIWDKNGIDQELVMLHCVTSYPTAPRDANLLVIKQLQKLGVTVGYSDHTMGIDAAVLSVALGARIIEKHFTIAKNYSDYHDHQISADPREFAQLVRKVNEAIEMLGNGEKRMQDCEGEIIGNVRRSIVASRNLDTGITLTWDDLTWVRPGGGLAPGRESEILGKTLSRPIQKGEMILVNDVFNDVER
jgi:N,N'-diacetyllegionaminate synthase